MMARKLIRRLGYTINKKISETAHKPKNWNKKNNKKFKSAVIIDLFFKRHRNSKIILIQ